MMRSSALPSAVLRRGVLAGAAVTATLVLSACGGAHGSSAGSGMNHGGMSATAAPSSSTGAFNDADVMFAQSMIVHHQQAIEMATLAGSRAADADVKQLAAKIRQAQQPEIDTMNTWLGSWGRPMPMPSEGMASAMPGMDHGSMPGIMTGEDMAKLGAAKGAAFDEQFLTMMISHHEGAIQMAQQEATQGSDGDAKALAQKIATDQQAEITMMKGILDKR